MIYNEMPWGELVTVEINDNYLIQQFVIEPGKETPLAYHKECDIELTVLSGHGLIDKPKWFNQMQYETFDAKSHFSLDCNSPYKIINQSSVDKLIILRTTFGMVLAERFQTGGNIQFDTYHIEKDEDYPSRIVLSDQFLF